MMSLGVIQLYYQYPQKMGMIQSQIGCPFFNKAVAHGMTEGFEHCLWLGAV